MRRRHWRKLVVAAAGLALLAGCSDEGALSGEPTAIRGAQLAMPSTLTPPVYVGGIEGAPDTWKLRLKVADALRQRDIPAGVKVRGPSSYILRGHVDRSGETAGYTQFSVKWTLFDPAGKVVGQVTQVAAVPRAALAGKNDDVIEAMADAAAESVSPIVPSSRLQTAQNNVSGLESPKTRRKVEAANPVTAIAKLGRKTSPLADNLLNRPDKETGKKTAAAPAADNKNAVTALGRMELGSSALSRNLLRGGRTTKDATSRDGTESRPEEPGERTPSSTTSDAPRPPARPKADAEPGSMTELFLRYPTSAERAGRTDIRPAAPPVGKSGRSATTSRAPRTQIAASPGDPSAPPARADVPDVRPAPAPRSARPASRYLYWVNVGSYRSRAVSQSQWASLKARSPALLGDRSATIRRAVVRNRGVYYRIQLGPYGSKSAALRFCKTLKDARIDCFLVAERNRAATPVRRAAPPAARTQPAKKALPATRPPAPDATDTPKRASPEPPKKAAPPAPRPAVRSKPGPSRDGNPPLSTSPGIPGLPTN